MYKRILLVAVLILTLCPKSLAAISIDSDIEKGTYKIYGTLEEARFNQIVVINVKSQTSENVFISYELSDNEGNFSSEFGLEDIPSGDYRVVLGTFDMNTPLELEEKIFYSNPDDITRSLEKINYIAGNETDREKAKADVISELNNNKRILGIDNKFYQDIPQSAFEIIADKILNDAPFSAESGLNKLINSFYDVFVVEVISNASEENIFEIVTELWDKYEFTESIVYPVYNELGENQKNIFLKMVGTYTSKEEINKAFCEQTVLEKIRIAEKWNDIYTVFNEYPSVFPFSFSDYKEISLQDLAVAAFGAEYESMNALKNRLDLKYQELIGKNSYVAGGGGSSGGGSGNAISAPAQSTIQIPEPEKESIFSDMEDARWAEEAVEYLYEKNAISGTGDGRFEPNRTITREEFVKIALVAFGLFEEGIECNFEDVEKSHWAADYIACAADKNIISGISETCFGIGQNITRQDMAVICKRAAEYAKKNYAEVNDITEFTDSSEISDYASDSVYTLYKWGMISGFEDSSFRPLANATRAQAASVICRLTKEE